MAILSATARIAFAQEPPTLFEARVQFISHPANFFTRPANVDEFLDDDLSAPDGPSYGVHRIEVDEHRYRVVSEASRFFDFTNVVVRGQSPKASGGGAGADAATDPSVPLTQLQLQNHFIPSTHNASGYSNQFIIQPVIPLNLNSEFFPYHIVRPTLPIIAPTADPDSPLAGVQGGLGDLLVADVFVHPIKELNTNVGGGYVTIIPTATHPQLGLREWQFGPALFAITSAIPKWNLGALVQVPFSMESDAYKVQMQPIAVRLLPEQWYVGWGDLLWDLDNQNGHYNIPINLRVGKVVKIGDQPINIFLQGFYTPDGLRKGPAAEWGIKLSVSLLLPNMKLDDPLFGPSGVFDHID